MEHNNSSDEGTDKLVELLAEDRRKKVELVGDFPINLAFTLTESVIKLGKSKAVRKKSEHQKYHQTTANRFYQI